jgi:hypothetical protein
MRRFVSLLVAMIALVAFASFASAEGRPIVPQGRDLVVPQEGRPVVPSAM